VAIVGRPNVGKSTLFNRLIGRREAIVDERPGVTRDRHFAAAEWNGRRFWLVDTGGLVPGADDALARAVRAQVEQAVAESDVVLFVVDVETGVHPVDLEIADALRRSGRPLLVVANKADRLPDDTRSLAFYELGLGEPFPVSAAVGKSTGDLLDRVAALLPAAAPQVETPGIAVAVVGRPNVGKSSLVNRLLGEERLVVAPEPGTTRDAIDTPLRYRGRTLVFIDTAGLRKRSKVADDIEFYATLRTARAMERAAVCVLVVDAGEGVHAQDLKIANEAWERGAALIVAVNKWDLVEEKDRRFKELGEEVEPFARARLIRTSARTGAGVRRVPEALRETHGRWALRAPTASVNEVLRAAQAERRAPGGVRYRYATEVSAGPPTFVLFGGRAPGPAYERFLENRLRRAFELRGVPVRLRFRPGAGRKRRGDR
jgi:GTP-binding protein